MADRISIGVKVFSYYPHLHSLHCCHTILKCSDPKPAGCLHGSIRGNGNTWLSSLRYEQELDFLHVLLACNSPHIYIVPWYNKTRQTWQMWVRMVKRRATNKHAWSCWKHQKDLMVLLHSPTGLHLHRGPSPLHKHTSYANSLLCLGDIHWVSVWPTVIPLFSSGWAG